MDFNERLARKAAAINECNDTDCACHQDADRAGDGAAEVTMTEVYDIGIPWDHHPSGW